MQASELGAIVPLTAATDQNLIPINAQASILSRFNHFLAKMAALEPTADLFAAAVQEMITLLDARFVAINLYCPERNVVICRAFVVHPDVGAHLLSIFGKPAVGYVVPLMPGALQQGLQEGRLHRVAGGLHELLARTIPIETCLKAERILTLESCYAVGMTWQGVILGAITFGAAAGAVIEPDLAEACAQQITVLHQQRETAQQLEEARALLEERIRQRTEELERSNQAMLVENQERKQVEDELRSSQANLRAIFENVEDSIWSVDRDYRLIIGNSGFQRNTTAAFGRPILPGESALNRDLSSNAYAQWKGYYDRALAGEHFVVEQPGQFLPSRMMEYRLGPILADDGSVVGVIAINRDVTKQSQTQQALRKNEEKYRRLFDNAPVGMFRTRMDGSEVLEINDRMAEMMRKDKSEIVGRSSIFNWADTPKRDLLLQTIAESGHVVAFEMPALISDGSMHTLLLSITVYPEENLLEGTAVDITERKQIEDALRESERRMADLLHNLPGMAYRCRNDKQYTAEFLSEGVEALTGYHADDIVDNRRLSYADLIEPEDRALVWDAVQAGVAEHRSFHMSYRIRSAAGLQKWVWEQGLAVYDPNGAILGLEGFIADITELKMAQEVMRESELRFRSLFEVSGVGTAIVGADEHILRANPALGKFLGYNPAHLVGKTVADLTYPDDLTVDAQLTQLLLAGDIPSFSIEKRYVTSTGEIVWGLLTASLVRDHNEAPLFLIGQVQDIDERKAVEIELERLYRQTRRDAQDKSILLNEVNHRVKNNLMAILGLLLAEQQFAPTKQHALLDTYFESAARRVRGLLEVHRLLSEHEWAPLRLSELNSRVIHAEVNALSLGERVQVEVAPSNISVSSRQASSLAIVINELLANSLKHALKAASVLQVSITASATNDHIQINYCDNGNGYPATVLHGEQHGVGLYLIRRIVERTLRGSLSIANEHGAMTQVVIPFDGTEKA